MFSRPTMPTPMDSGNHKIVFFFTEGDSENLAFLRLFFYQILLYVFFFSVSWYQCDGVQHEEGLKNVRLDGESIHR